MISRRDREHAQPVQRYAHRHGLPGDAGPVCGKAAEVQHDERFLGHSTYTFGKLWKLASEAIIAYSDKPLRLSIKLGFAISALAFVSGSYIIYMAIVYGVPIQGWTSLIVSLYFLGGIIISILGVIGVYLGKAFDEAKRRPLYIVRQTTFDAASRRV